MTAEVIVMNKQGLALAADSAATISPGDQTKKIYNTSNKLFALSKYRPVGVMIYGSAEIMGLPWEVVIKRYREHLKNSTFPTFNKYCEHFFDYLSKNAFDKNCYVSYVKRQTMILFANIAHEADSKIEKTIKENNGIEEKAIAEIHNNCIQQVYSDIKHAQKQFKVKIADIKKSLENHRSVVSQILENIIENRPIRGALKKKLVDACLLFAILFPGINESGVVLAGFGDNEAFPSVKAFKIQKILDGNVQFKQEFSHEVTLEKTVCIRAFAQKSQVQNFMNGFSSRMADYIFKNMKEILSKEFGEQVSDLLIKDGLISKDQKAVCKRYIESAGRGVYSCLRDRFSEISRREFVSPVVNAVEFFSPTEMARMAETLVSLESFRQQVTLSHETVGGPIDVSVITRGDGFIWIKRKHYFDPKLNNQFFYNYNRKIGDSNEDQNN